MSQHSSLRRMVQRTSSFILKIKQISKVILSELKYIWKCIKKTLFFTEFLLKFFIQMYCFLIYFSVIISPSSFPCSYLCTAFSAWQLSLSLGCTGDHSSLFLLLSLFFIMEWLQFPVLLPLLLFPHCLQDKFIFLSCCRSLSFSRALPLHALCSPYALTSHLYKALPLSRLHLFFPYSLLLHSKPSEGQRKPQRLRGTVPHWFSNLFLLESPISVTP